MRRPLRAALRALFFAVPLLLGAGAAFYTGYAAGRTGASLPVVGTLPLPSQTARPTADPAASAAEGAGVVGEAWRIVADEFYDPRALDRQKLTYGAVKGLLSALDDPNTGVADQERTRQQSDEIRGAFDGIGISVEARDGRLLVSRVLDESPALAVGIHAGDTIAQIDGVELRDPSLPSAVERLRGPRGSRVVLTVTRPGESQPLRIEVTRGEIKTAPVRGQMLPGDIAYVRLPSFSAATSKDLHDQFVQLLERRPTGLVVDLRNNPGGLLQSAVDVASQFLDDGVVVYEQRRDREPTPFYVRRSGPVVDLPMVVLVNHGSASAAEILAGALQDRQRALLVGETTYGKDSIQNVHRLSDQSSIRVTFAKWYTPLRQSIGGHGLTPDIVIPLSEQDRREGRDPQLERAIDYLRTRLARAS